eukprot:scaffold2560_cov116-Isochrysis_galbana.AAC.2
MSDVCRLWLWRPEAGAPQTAVARRRLPSLALAAHCRSPLATPPPPSDPDTPTQAPGPVALAPAPDLHLPELIRHVAQQTRCDNERGRALCSVHGPIQ